MRTTLFLAICSLLCCNSLLSQALTFNTCADVTVCLDQNSCTQATALLSNPATTSCFNPSINYDYRIDLAANGSVDVMGDGESVTQVLPFGQSRITWRAIDNCGNARTCTQTITVRDCQIPNLTCLSGLNQGLDGNCEASFQPQSFILNASDNCTPANQLQFGIRKAGNGSGFPSTTSVTFGKCDVGTNFVEVWVRDANGFTNQCANYIIVQNNSGLCNCIEESNITLKGCARSNTDNKLMNYQLKAQVESINAVGSPIAVLQNKTVVFPDSCYSLKLEDLPIATNLRVTLSGRKNDQVTNGFSTFDLSLISRHIIGAEPFTSFYQEIAADINQSNNISTFDIVEGRKLLLGIYDTFPNSPSWRFVRPIANPDVLNAWSQLKTTYEKDYPLLTGDVTTPNIQWIGVKIGDINQSAMFMGAADDRQSLQILLDDVELRPGALMEVPLYLAQRQDALSWQLALQTDPSEIEIEAIDGISGESCAVLRDGQIRFAWIAASGEATQFDPKNPLCVLRLRSKKTRLLSQVLAQNPAALDGEMSNTSGSVYGLSLAFRSTGGMEAISTPRIFAPYPNPSSQSFSFGLLLQEPAFARLEIMDINGRSLYVAQDFFEKGYQQWDLPANVVEQTGVYMYRIAAGATQQSGKLVRTE